MRRSAIRNSFVITFLSILLMLPATLLAAQQSLLQDVLATVKTGYTSMEDLHAEFSQRTYVSALKREEKGSGEVFLKKQGGSAMFRFNYVRPKQQIISNGRNVWYYLPENRQVIISETAKLFSGGNGIALSYLTGLGNLSDDFSIRLLSETPDNKGNYQLELIPKKHNNSVAKLYLHVPADAVEKVRGAKIPEAFFPIASSVLHDQMGNRTTIEYSKVRVNGKLTDDRFNFKTPKGVEVIKQ
jgi:outer membrane lipoprotein carrier protein